MGDEADYLTEWDDFSEDQRPRRAYITAPRRSGKSRVGFQTRDHLTTHHHHPATDQEAKDLIAQLDHYEWETHKVTGRFDRNPYTITATINGQHRTIHLPGRFGGVLRWLDRAERKLHEQKRETNV